MNTRWVAELAAREWTKQDVACLRRIVAGIAARPGSLVNGGSEFLPPVERARLRNYFLLCRRLQLQFPALHPQLAPLVDRLRWLLSCYGAAEECDNPEPTPGGE